jgi:hypothetical protein
VVHLKFCSSLFFHLYFYNKHRLFLLLNALINFLLFIHLFTCVYIVWAISPRCLPSLLLSRPPQIFKVSSLKLYTPGQKMYICTSKSSNLGNSQRVGLTHQKLQQTEVAGALLFLQLARSNSCGLFP